MLFWCSACLNASVPSFTTFLSNFQSCVELVGLRFARAAESPNGIEDAGILKLVAIASFSLVSKPVKQE